MTAGDLEGGEIWQWTGLQMGAGHGIWGQGEREDEVG